jgi:glycolate oxidase iron-sulfur subunit
VKIDMAGVAHRTREVSQRAAVTVPLFPPRVVQSEQENPEAPGQGFPTALADRCVMCGMCLTVCPTYGKTQNEAESPRGRIALMRAFTQGLVPVTERGLGHLDRCLACRACESICPADVPYGQLLDAARAELEPRRRRPALSRLARRAGLALLAADPKSWLRAGRWVRSYQRLHLGSLARRSGLLRVLGLEAAEAALPTLERPFTASGYHPPLTRERGRVALFVGCVARLVDTQTLTAAMEVLRQLGYGVYVPPGQRCCGALHRHSGDAQTASCLADSNLEAFAGLPVEAVLGTASGCTATLAEYTDWLPRGRVWRVRVADISQFLTERWPERVALAPLARRVAVHTPCTLSNVLGAGTGPATLLSHIPAIRIEPLPDRPACCGAAADYMLREPAMARALREDLLAGMGADYLATSNLGCALHIAQAIGTGGRATEVLHPVTLIARQLKAAPVS